METEIATTAAETVVGPTGIAGIIQLVSTFMMEGGVFMFVILGVWLIGLAICFERFARLYWRYDVDGASLMNELQRYILSNDIQGAIRACSGSVALLPKVLKSALKRANQSPEQIQNALDASALEVVPKAEARLNYLSLIANISTLIGLLGTIQGLIASFGAIAVAEPSQKAEVLSKGIAVAMNTTFFGLVSAITIMVMHSFLMSKSEKIIGEIDEYSVKMMDLLGTKNSK